MCINVTFSFPVLSAKKPQTTNKKKTLGFLLAGQGANISVEASIESQVTAIESWSC